MQPPAKIKKVFLVILDISGYTKFIKAHKISLIHAERIIDELIESVIDASEFPLVLHELEGDAVTFYALSDGSPEMAHNVCSQALHCVATFRKREREMVGECKLCACDACTTVGRLKLKAVLHHGEAVFTQVRQFTKLSGEDMILVHRLLKNSIGRKEYILLTESLHGLGADPGGWTLESRSEDCEGLGRVNVKVYYPPAEDGQIEPVKVSLAAKLKMFAKTEWDVIKRLVIPSTKRYPNLESAQQAD